jgi:hypothetical protein
MKMPARRSIVSLAALLLISCSSARTPTAPEALSAGVSSTSVAAPPTSPSAAAKRDVVPVVLFGSGTPVPGSEATLLRDPSGVTMTLRTSGLAGGAYTTWWVVFNNPENCSGGVCGENDLPPFGGSPTVHASVLFATGHVVSDNGNASFGAWLGVGDTNGALFGPGLVNIYTAEIHNIVRYHGDVLPAYMPAQISSFNGGCPPNSCYNVQAAPHRP